MKVDVAYNLDAQSVSFVGAEFLQLITLVYRSRSWSV